MTRGWKILLLVALATLLALGPGAMLRHRSHHRTHHHRARHTVHAAKVAVASPKLFGFNDNSVLMQQSGAKLAIQRIQPEGANLIRYTVNWDYVEQTQGSFNWRGYDPLYDAAIAAGVKPVIVIAFSPAWARPLDVSCGTDNAHCNDPPDSTHDGAWYDFVKAVATRYPQAAAIEIWNEPNLVNFWKSGPDAVRYAHLETIAYDAVKSAVPSMTVLGGALSNIQYDQAPSIAYQTYLTTFLDQHPKLDALSIHDYPIAGLAPTWFTDTLAIARTALDNHNLGTMPMWVTEFGISTTGRYAVSEAAQASRLVSMLTTLGKRTDVKAALIHTVIPAPTGQNSIEYGYAIVNGDGTAKPAYCAIPAARLLPQPFGCPVS